MITFTNESLQRIGAKAVYAIIQRVQNKGLDIYDSPMKEYSTRPFAIPIGAAKSAIKRIAPTDKAYFKTKSGATWVVIKNGYAALKKQLYAGTSWDGRTVNLTQSGLMMKSIKVINVGNNKFTIGFDNRDGAQRALWNIQNGRNFFGISPSDLEKVKEAVIDEMPYVKI